MIRAVAAFLSDVLKLSVSDRILVALSGGVDSVALVHVLHRLSFRIGIAHVNYGLRGEESDADERLSAKLAQQLDVPFFVTRFDTKSLAAKEGKSVQELARDLRYHWLEELRLKEGYDWLATAHHRNDAIETALFHFGRGTGIRGLRGIPAQNQRIIRPFIGQFRSDILHFARREQLQWREDASNALSLYQRNYLRNEVMPKLEGLHGGFEKGAAQTLDHVRAAVQWYDWAIAYWKERVMRASGELWMLDKDLLRTAPDPGGLLWEILHPLGFSATQVKDILDEDTRIGAVFLTPTHRLVQDRTCWVLGERPTIPTEVYSLLADQAQLLLPWGQLHCIRLAEPPRFFEKDPQVAFLALEAEDFPLQVRNWQPGDLFQPFGMRGKHQKVQDFLTHRKLSLPEKEQVRVLVTARGQICWIMGYRTDERFRVSPDSRQVWRIEIKISL